MMAAHDTLTSSLTAFVDRLAANPGLAGEAPRRASRPWPRAQRALAVRAPRRSRAHRDGVQGSAAADAAGAVDPAARLARVRVQRLPHPGQHRGERQPDLHPLHAATMARPGALRSDALYAGGDRAAGTNSPSSPLAAAPICASGCILLTCRPNVLPGTCSTISASQLNPAMGELAPAADPAIRATDCR